MGISCRMVSVTSPCLSGFWLCRGIANYEVLHHTILRADWREIDRDWHTHEHRKWCLFSFTRTLRQESGWRHPDKNAIRELTESFPFAEVKMCEVLWGYQSPAAHPEETVLDCTGQVIQQRRGFVPGSGGEWNSGGSRGALLPWGKELVWLQPRVDLCIPQWLPWKNQTLDACHNDGMMPVIIS